MTRRKYLRDSVTGKPYDPDTKQYILDEFADSVSADLLGALATPADTALTPDNAAAVVAPQRKPASETPPPYVPPPGIPADPVAWLAMLRDGPVSEEAARYLRNPTALAQYEGANNNAKAQGISADVTALADAIIDAWRAWLAANPDTAPSSDPFQLAP